MGLLDPLKKLLFGVKGVSKHQAEQAIDYTKEKGEEMFDKTVDMIKDAGQVIGKTGAKVLDKVDDLWEKKTYDFEPPAADKPKEKLTNEEKASAPSPVSDFVEPIKDKLDKMGDAAAETFDKVKDAAKNIGGKMVESSDDFWKKAEDFSEDVVEKARTKGSALYDKAKSIAEEKAKDLNHKIDEFIEKEKAIEAKEPKGEFADTPITENKNLTEPLMKKHEDFFDKAKKFLDDADQKKSKPVVVEAKKVEPTVPEVKQKPLEPKAQNKLNDLLSSSTKPDDIEDADIVDEVPPTK